MNERKSCQLKQVKRESWHEGIFVTGERRPFSLKKSGGRGERGEALRDYGGDGAKGKKEKKRDAMGANLSMPSFRNGVNARRKG